MDKHLRLFEMLPQDGMPVHLNFDGLFICDSEDGPYLDDTAAQALIEHAAMVWLMGRGFCMGGVDEYSQYLIWRVGEPTHKDTKERSLIDALLAAAEHARDGGEGN